MNLKALSKKLILSITLISSCIAIKSHCAAPKSDIVTRKNYINDIKVYLQLIKQLDHTIVLKAVNAKEMDRLSPWLAYDNNAFEKALSCLNLGEVQNLLATLEHNYKAALRYQSFSDPKEIAEALDISAASESDRASAASNSDFGSAASSVAEKEHNESKQLTAKDLAATSMNDADFARYLANQNPHGQSAAAASQVNPHHAMHHSHHGAHHGCHGRMHGRHHKHHHGHHHRGHHWHHNPAGGAAAAYAPAAAPHHGHSHHPHECHKGHLMAAIMHCKRK